jgi:hypothetical protein
MRALSIKQPWANMIVSGEKTIETRVWSTSYRGDILLVSTRSPNIQPAGYALAIAKLVDWRPMTSADVADAKCALYKNAFSWVLNNIRPITPFPVRGRLGLYEIRIDQDKLLVRT